MSAEARPVSEINITPLIDVMLVLLIIFMVVVPVASRGLDAALPRPASSEAAIVPPPIVVSVEGTGVAVGGTPFMTVGHLESHLRDLLAARTERVVFLRASGTVRYSRVVEVLDSAAAAGAERVGLVLTAGATDEVGGHRPQ